MLQKNKIGSTLFPPFPSCSVMSPLTRPTHLPYNKHHLTVAAVGAAVAALFPASSFKVDSTQAAQTSFLVFDRPSLSRPVHQTTTGGRQRQISYLRFPLLTVSTIVYRKFLVFYFRAGVTAISFCLLPALSFFPNEACSIVRTFLSVSSCLWLNSNRTTKSRPEARAVATP